MNSRHLISLLLVAIFIVLETIVMTEIVLTFLPTTETQVSIIERDVQESHSYYPGKRGSVTGQNYSLKLLYPNNQQKIIQVPEAVFQQSLSGLQTLYRYVVKESVLLDFPVALGIQSKSIELPPMVKHLVTMKQKTMTEKPVSYYSLLMPITGLFLMALFFAAILTYLIRRFIFTHQLPRGVFILISMFSIGIGEWWLFIRFLS